MILVDTAIWIDHLRNGEPRLASLLDEGQVLGHAGVTGELALARLSQRSEILTLLANLRQARSAAHSEVMGLAATLLTDGARLWTRDRRLSTAAVDLGLAAEG